MARIIGGIAHLGGSPKCVRHARGGALVVGGESNAHMAIVEYGIIGAIGFVDLIERLRDQKALDAVVSHEGERGLEEIETAERRKFVEHQQ